MQSYSLAQFPAPFRTVHLALFKNVTNAPEIRKRLVEAAVTPGAEGDALRSKVDYGFIDASLIVSSQHILTAILTTLLIALPGQYTASSPPPTPKTRSHNLHSEILLTLSPNNNISESIRRHGLSDQTTYLLVLRFGDGEAADVWKGIEEVVRGDLVEIGALDAGEDVDWPRVDKIYKTAELSRLPLSQAEITEKKIAAVINTVAVKHVT